MENKISKIKTRSGRIAKFSIERINDAILKSLQSAEQGDEALAKKITDELIKVINKRFNKEEIPDVEEVQDLIEEVLVLEGLTETVKSFVLYRDQRRKIREITVANESNIERIDNYLDKSDWEVNENANMAFSLQGLNHHAVSYNIKKYWLNKIYPKEIREANESGDFHLHNLDSLAPYCAGYDLYDFLKKGFSGAPGKLESSPPKHFRTVLGQIVNFVYTLSGEIAGAISFSNFDTLIAPFIRYDKLNKKQVKQALQEFLFNMATPTRVGFQCPFSNITLDLTPSSTFSKTPIIIGGENKEETYSDFQEEMNLFNECFFEVMLEGDKNQRVFTFPIPTINITKDFDWNNPSLKPMWEATAKYGINYFANYINSDMKPEQVRSMCCRLRLDLKELMNRGGGGLFGSGSLTGSIGVVTINMPRIGYLSKTKKEFFRRLDNILNLAKQSLELKRKTIETLAEKGLYPYSRFYLAGIKSSRGEYYNNHFSTIGIVGMNEMLLNFLDENISTEKGRKFALEVLDFIRDKLIKIQKETGNIYNLEASPSEACLVGNTLIKTIDGDKQIKDLVGKTPVIYTYDEKDNKIKLKKVSKVWKTSDFSQIHRVWFDDGSYIDCTGNHPFARHSNGKGKKHITWVPAALLKVGYSIKHINIDKTTSNYCVINSHTLRSRLIYEYFANKKLTDRDIIHHKDFNKKNDDYSNLQKMSEKEHKRLHFMSCISDFCKNRSGEKNSFYGKKHTLDSKNKISKTKTGVPFRLKNISKEKFSSIMSKIAKEKPANKHSRFRRDIKDSDIIKQYNAGKSVYEIAKKLKCKESLIICRFSRLKLNHKIVKIEFLDKMQPVYNMEVEDTNCFFAGSGSLVHNTSYRLCLNDIKKYPDIITAGSKQRPYYTNSTLLPANYSDDVFEVLKLQDELQCKYSGGTVLHMFIGEYVTDTESLKSLIKKTFENFKLPYITITPTFSICPVHGYLSGENFKCPKCRIEEPEEIFTNVEKYGII